MFDKLTNSKQLRIHFDDTGHIEERKEWFVSNCLNHELQRIRWICDAVDTTDYRRKNSLCADCRTRALGRVVYAKIYALTISYAVGLRWGENTPFMEISQLSCLFEESWGKGFGKRGIMDWLDIHEVVNLIEQCQYPLVH